jgi:hypothetical protein
VDASDEEVNWWTQLILSKNHEHKKLCFENQNVLKWPDHHQTKNGNVFSIDSVVA